MIKPHLISSMSIVPPPSVSKAVKIQLSLSSGVSKLVTLFAWRAYLYLSRLVTLFAWSAYLYLSRLVTLFAWSHIYICPGWSHYLHGVIFIFVQVGHIICMEFIFEFVPVGHIICLNFTFIFVHIGHIICLVQECIFVGGKQWTIGWHIFECYEKKTCMNSKKLSSPLLSSSNTRNKESASKPAFQWFR